MASGLRLSNALPGQPSNENYDVVEERVDDRRGKQVQEEGQGLPADDRVPDAPVCRRTHAAGKHQHQG